MCVVSLSFINNEVASYAGFRESRGLDLHIERLCLFEVREDLFPTPWI